MIDVRFPNVSARNLEGGKVEVPGDLTGAANLLVLASSREHQHPVETWLPRLSALKEDFPKLETWRLVVLPRGYRFMRGAIEGGLRAGVTDRVARQRTLVSFIDLDDLRRPLGLPDMVDIHLYLLDASGTVRWEGRAGYSPAALSGLTAVLAGLLGRP
ncbi:MAG: hypothetical protein M1274_06570 [Actinobacteria bacterium]|nr:hypothetical protein [Actinomycetota bacterium]